jgi:hypothetical protein
MSAPRLYNKLSTSDLTEGGHLGTDSGAFSFAEWWYLNGKLELEAEDGEKRSVGWFSTMGHQDSPSITDGNIQLSHLFKFSALYNEDGTNHFVYTDTYIPRSAVNNFIGIHKAYLLFHYPDTPSAFFGSAATGYTVNDQLENIKFSMFFKPQVNKTLEQAGTPLQFTTCVYANGKIGGTITIDGKQFFVKKGNAYFDHMIPTADIPWPMKMNGWSWAEVTTQRYQAVIYAIRSLDDGFKEYSYKHLTLIDLENGEVVAEFHNEEVEIIEGDWKEETTYGVSRPQSVTYKAGKFEASVFADSTATLDRNIPGLIGFVNFMAYQKKGATVKRNDRTFSGSAFYEYLVSDKGAVSAKNR